MPSRPNIEHLPSPNHGSRRGHAVDMLLLHYTGMRSAEGALKWLRDPASRVSSHYFVFADGRIVQLVDEAQRAWHAGESSWAGETDINARSIGVEIDNPGHEFGYRAFPDTQIGAVIALSRDILARHAIPAERVLAHADVAPMRKQDPGELFPWARLHEEGVGHWVEPAPLAGGEMLKRGEVGEAVLTIQERFRRYGYGLGTTGEFDAETEAVVTAFQRHFRPARVDGIADPSTVATLDRLIDALPAGA